MRRNCSHFLSGLGKNSREHPARSANVSISGYHHPAASAATLNSMVFVLDNYDSFTYNLVQYLGELGVDIEVRRNDELTVEEVERLKPDRILLSPGPCTPGEAGILVPLIRHMAGKAPILGVCLGHQAIGEAFGGQVVRAKRLMHGKTSASRARWQGHLCRTAQSSDLHALPFTDRRTSFTSARTHHHGSYFESKARAAAVIMGVRHRTLPIEGVQFHPESVLTEGGHQMIRNFLEM